MKKLAAVLLSLFFCLSCLILSPALATGADSGSTKHADALNSLGLFQGTEQGYELQADATRIQGLVMLIRLLGEEDEALAHTGANPFDDVPGWAVPYTAYSYAKGYTDGTGERAFSPNDALNAKSYVTFVLRALGYKDAAGDFSWATAPADSARLGLMTAGAANTLAALPSFNRGDMVDISYCALTIKLKGSSSTLAAKLAGDGVFTRALGEKAGVMGGQVTYEYTSESAAPTGDTGVSYDRRTYDLPSGVVTASVVTVDLSNPRVSVRAAMTDGVLGAVKPFREIVADSNGAYCVIDANFMNDKTVTEETMIIGHLMSEGEFIYGVSGVTSFGFTHSGKVTVGKPALFFRVSCSASSKNWPCYEVNSEAQDYYNAIVYTPRYLSGTLPVTCDGTLVLISSGAVTEYRPCYAGETVSIPADGYAMWLGGDYVSTPYYRAPVVGDKVKAGFEPYFFRQDEEGFTLEGVENIVSGAPRLIKDGQIVTELETGFTEERFTTIVSSRTAIGTLSDTKIVLVCCGGATIQQMRELMQTLGCVDAVNLDGGGSCAMYCDGTFISDPIRPLACTLQVYVK